MEGSVQPAATLPDFLSDSDTESDLSPEFPIKEEMIEEVMRELYKEIVGPAAGEEAPAVVEGGNSESCGAAATVMEGVKYGAGRMMDGCDEAEYDDEWVERVMGWGPVEMEGWGVGA